MSEKAMMFFVDDNFKFVLGSEKKPVDVPRLLFKNGKKVAQIVGAVLGKDSKRVLQILGKAEKANILKDDKSYSDYADFVGEAVKAMVEAKNHTMLVELMAVISEGAITEEIMGSMQYDEVAKVLAYLVDSNYSSLKNLFASLNVMSTSLKSDGK